VRRNRTEKQDYDGNPIPATTRSDDVRVSNVSPWLEGRVELAPWLRGIVGVRLDYAHFDVDGATSDDTGSENDVIASPKGSLVIGPFADTELYLSGGTGFHSNDARGVVTRFDSADPLVRSYGAEIGLRSAWLSGLHSTLAFWWLDLDDELVFVGDAGTTESTRPSRRYGVEIANYYDPTPWLTLDVDAAFSHARFRDDEPEGDHIPGSIESVVAAGISLHDLGGFFGAVRLRYFGPRPLIEDDRSRSDDTILLSARVGYELSEVWTISAEIFNLLDRDDSEIDYFYASRLQGEPAGPDEGGTNDIHFHPVDPISFRAMLTARF
jgi:outer membrane receptor protein involved in Fe transport